MHDINQSGTIWHTPSGDVFVSDPDQVNVPSQVEYPPTWLIGPDFIINSSRVAFFTKAENQLKVCCEGDVHHFDCTNINDVWEFLQTQLSKGNDSG